MNSCLDDLRDTEETVLGELELGGNMRYPTKAIFVSEYEAMNKRQYLSIKLVCAIRFGLSYKTASGRQMQNMKLYCHESV